MKDDLPQFVPPNDPERRAKVLDMRANGFPQHTISLILQVSPATIQYDLDFVRQEQRRLRAIQEDHDRDLEEYRLDQNLRAMSRIRDSKETTPSDKIAATRVCDEISASRRKLKGLDVTPKTAEEITRIDEWKDDVLEAIGEASADVKDAVAAKLEQRRSLRQSLAGPRSEGGFDTDRTNSLGTSPVDTDADQPG